MFDEFDSLVCLDVETSGLVPRREEIIELGVVKARSLGGEELGELSTLVRLPEGRRLPPKITEITGITEAMLIDQGIAKEEAAEKLAELLAGRPLVVAYNAQFDMCFIFYLLASVGRAEVLKNIKMLDAMTVYKDRRDYPHRLENAVAEYALSTKSTHRAVDDARATLELMEAMASERGDLERYINLFGYNPKYGVSGPRISSITYRAQGYDRTLPLYERKF